MLLCIRAVTRNWGARQVAQTLLFGHHIPAAQPRNCTTQYTSLIHCGARRSWRRTVVCQRGKPPSNSLYCVSPRKSQLSCTVAPQISRETNRCVSEAALYFDTHCFLIQDLRVLCYTHWRGKTGTMHVYCYQLPASASIPMCSTRHTPESTPFRWDDQVHEQRDKTDDKNQTRNSQTRRLAQRCVSGGVAARRHANGQS